jgi:hypothetical protein
MTKDERKEYNKLYYIKNREKILNNQKQKEESEHRKNWKREYRINNIERTKEYDKARSKKYREKNKEKIKIYLKEYNKKRLETDQLYKLLTILRKRIRESLKYGGFSKKSKTKEILGCDIVEFKIHLEKQFEPWMNWGNYGNPKDGIFELNKTWDIDHIIPTSSSKNEEQLLQLNHYTNLKPLCSYTNRWIKNGKNHEGTKSTS